MWLYVSNVTRLFAYEHSASSNADVGKIVSITSDDLLFDGKAYDVTRGTCQAHKYAKYDRKRGSDRQGKSGA